MSTGGVTTTCRAGLACPWPSSCSCSPGSLAYFELLDGGTAFTSRPTADPGPLVVTYSATARNPDRGLLGTIALDGSDLRNVIEPPGGGRLAVNASPAVSPGGDTAAFQRAVAGPGGGHLPHILVIPLDGSKPERRLTNGAGAEVDPTWSPDGNRIAFTRQVAGRFELFACAGDGAGLTRLTATPRVDELAPAWSPDGAQLALLMDGHVAVTDRDGAAVRGLTADEEPKDGRPSWSPDGSRIAFTRDPGSIVISTSRGSNERKVPFDRAATGVAWVAEG